jgi:hypothetical protein
MKETATAERVAEEALRILEKEGENAVSMRRVAQAVGITPMAIYHHFPNREALLDFVVDRTPTLTMPSTAPVSSTMFFPSRGRMLAAIRLTSAPAVRRR